MNVFEELRAGKPYHILDPDYREQAHGVMSDRDKAEAYNAGKNV